MKCFGCGEEGHTVEASPRQGDLNPAGPGGAVGAGVSPPAPSPGALGRRGSAAWQSAPPAGEPPAAAPIVVSERPAAAPRAAPRGAAAVEDATHRVSSVNAEGVCVNDVSESGNEVLGGTEESVVVGGKEKEASVNAGGEQVGLVGIREGGQAVDIGKVQTEEVIDEVEVDGREEKEATEVVKTVGLLSAKRRRKVKNASSEANSSKVCAEDRQADKGASTDESGSDEYVSDGSEVLGLTSSQQRTQYTADRISVFLKQTKNQHKVKIEDFFPNLICFAPLPGSTLARKRPHRPRSF